MTRIWRRIKENWQKTAGEIPLNSFSKCCFLSLYDLIKCTWSFSEEESDEDEEQEDIFSGGEDPGFDSGCTAVVALKHGYDLYVANAGDSRCVVSRQGKAIEMSFDHKPEDELEKNRIQKAGGWVTPDGRVKGGLNLSRSLGKLFIYCSILLSNVCFITSIIFFVIFRGSYLQTEQGFV